MPVKVLTVDDAVVVRKILTEVIGADPGLEVVGTAPNGKLALSRIEQLEPDIVTLDVEMPEMDGIETLKAIRQLRPSLPVVMFSTLTARGAETTLEALASGATDYVAKPANVGSTTEAIEAIRSELVPLLRALGNGETRLRRGGSAATQPAAAQPAEYTTRAQSGKRIEAVIIGSSTGGPVALETVLGALSSPLPVPVVVVQHMPPTFTAMLADRLNRRTVSTVVEASEGQVLRPGTVYIAPGGLHLELLDRPDGTVVRLYDDEPINSCKPAVDPLFTSAAKVWGSRQLGLILTGMGKDGLEGCRALAAREADVYAQDEATSVVWGMPGYVTEAGLSTRVLPLDEIAPALIERVDSRKPTRPEPAAQGSRP
jgi:two-component system chemotaxis response regulator CheB